MTTLHPERTEFSVYKYSNPRRYDVVCSDVLLRVAAAHIVDCINSTEAKDGAVFRIILTDGGDRIVFEWKYDAGVTFPPNLKGMDLTVPPPQSRSNEALENLPPGDAGGHSGVLSV
jgi:hypothetical protein